MTQEINRKLHEALGEKWYRYSPQDNPDYCADPRLVIEAMQEREDWPKFVYYIASSHLSTILDSTYAVINLIMDRTGELAKLATEWLKEKEK